MKKFFIAIFTLLTGIGGHFINRRWDKALLFFGLAVITIASFYMAMLYYISNPSLKEPADIAMSIWTRMDSLIFNFAIVYLILITISAIVSFVDANKRIRENDNCWTISGILGSILLTITMTGFSLLLLSMFNLYSDQQAFGTTSSSTSSAQPNPSPFTYSHFWKHETFGGFDYDIRSPKVLPAGDNSINILFAYNNKPVENLSVKFKVNGKYETSLLTTDENGYIHIPTQESTNYINKLIIEGWKDAPVVSDNITVVTGTESKAHSNYSKYPWGTSNGLKVEASDDTSANPLTFKLEPSIHVLWPTKETKNSPVKTKGSTLKWSAIDDASFYIVDIHSVEREGSRSTYRNVASKKVNLNALKLATLKTITDPDNSYEYTVKISAFRDDNSFISNTSGFYDTPSFILADGGSIVEDDITNNPITGSDYQQLRDHKTRYTVVQSLIDENTLDLANSLLETIPDDYKPGKKYALQALILAKKNKCKQANILIKKSIKLGGCKCSIKKTQNLCPSKP